MNYTQNGFTIEVSEKAHQAFLEYIEKRKTDVFYSGEFINTYEDFNAVVAMAFFMGYNAAKETANDI